MCIRFKPQLYSATHWYIYSQMYMLSHYNQQIFTRITLGWVKLTLEEACPLTPAIWAFDLVDPWSVVFVKADCLDPGLKAVWPVVKSRTHEQDAKTNTSVPID